MHEIIKQIKQHKHITYNKQLHIKFVNSLKKKKKKKTIMNSNNLPDFVYILHH